jgi:hypothetical protein
VNRHRIVIDRRSVRADQITHLIMSIIRQHVGHYLNSNEAQDAAVERDLMRDLKDQLWADGAHMITEGDRIAAGLPPRNIYGLTVDELRIIEDRMIMAMLQPTPPNFVFDPEKRWLNVSASQLSIRSIFAICPNRFTASASTRIATTTSSACWQKTPRSTPTIMAKN